MAATEMDCPNSEGPATGGFFCSDRPHPAPTQAATAAAANCLVTFVVMMCGS
jgi:hypothetical protein